MFFDFEDSSLRRLVESVQECWIVIICLAVGWGLINACYSIGWLLFELYIPCFVFKAGMVVGV